MSHAIVLRRHVQLARKLLFLTGHVVAIICSHRATNMRPTEYLLYATSREFLEKLSWEKSCWRIAKCRKLRRKLSTFLGLFEWRNFLCFMPTEGVGKGIQEIDILEGNVVFVLGLF